MQTDKNILDCGSSSCMFAETLGGMRTNGKCQCFDALEQRGDGRKESFMALRLVKARFQQVRDERNKLRKALHAMLNLDKNFKAAKMRHIEELAEEGDKVAAAVLLARRALNIGDPAA